MGGVWRVWVSGLVGFCRGRSDAVVYSAGATITGAAAIHFKSRSCCKPLAVHRGQHGCLRSHCNPSVVYSSSSLQLVWHNIFHLFSQK